MVRIAINGFGRIGRQVFQAGFKDPDIEWVCINDLSQPEQMRYLLKYDSVYGIQPYDVRVDGNTLVVADKTIPLISERDPAKLPWKQYNVDVVIESTGLFTTRDKAALHIEAGAKKVLISAPSKDADWTVVRGVNEHEYDPKKHIIVSNASCTTNCLAPIVKVLHDNFCVQRGCMVTIHSYTADQNLVDGFHKKDMRRGRAAAQNMVPTTTGAARAVTKVIPSLHGKLDGCAIRVPVVCGSFVEFTCDVEKQTNKEHINQLFASVAEYHLNGVLEYTTEPLVSRDILRNPHSCVFDASMTNTIENQVFVCGWYDNEWGYANRMIDIAKLLFSRG